MNTDVNTNVNSHVNSNTHSNTHTNAIGAGDIGREIAVDVDQFVDRYIAVWNETDPVARRRRIAEVWAADAVELTPEARYQGLEALEERVTSAHNQLVRDGGYLFHSAGDATAHHGAVSFTTHMIPSAGGDIAWTGRTFAALDEDRRIRYEYQFTVDLTKAPA